MLQRGLRGLDILGTKEVTLSTGGSSGGEGPQSDFLRRARVEVLESPEHLWITSGIQTELQSCILQINEDRQSHVAISFQLP